METRPESFSRAPLGERRTIANGALVLVVSLILFFPALGTAPLFDDDETRFASVAREMRQSGDWVVPRFNGEITDKPPLHFWIMASAFSLFGEGAAQARLGSALFSLVSVLSLFWLASRLYDQEVGKWSALALATSLLFVAEARLATTDAALLMLVSLVFALAAGGWWDREGRVRMNCGGLASLSVSRAIAIGFVAGLGVLCKGPAAFLLPLATMWLFAFCLDATGKKEGFVAWLWRSFKVVRPGGLAGGLLAAAVPWHAAVWKQAGAEWFGLFYGLHYLGRLAWLEPLTGLAMAPPEGHAGFPLFQVVALFGGLFPWSVFLPLALWHTLRGASQAKPENSAAATYFSLWLLVWTVAVGFSSTQLPHYSFPAYPAACVMIASLVVRALRYPAAVSSGWLYAAAGGLLAGGFVLLAVPLVAARWLELPILAKLAWVGAIPLATASIFALAVYGKARRPAMWCFLAGAILLQSVVFQAVLPALGLSGGAMRAVEKAGEVVRDGKRWASYRYSSPGLVWACGGRVTFCQSAAEVADFLRSGEGAFAVVATDQLGEVQSALGSPPEELARWRPPERRSKVALLRSAP